MSAGVARGGGKGDKPSSHIDKGRRQTVLMQKLGLGNIG